VRSDRRQGIVLVLEIFNDDRQQFRKRFFFGIQVSPFVKICEQRDQPLIVLFRYWAELSTS
jgi:hypothetical protein